MSDKDYDTIYEFKTQLLQEYQGVIDNWYTQFIATSNILIRANLNHDKLHIF